MEKREGMRVTLSDGEVLSRGDLSRSELTSGPQPDSRHGWCYVSGYCVYFPISAKFILSFLLIESWSIMPYRKPRSSVFSILGA